MRDSPWCGLVPPNHWTLLLKWKLANPSCPWGLKTILWWILLLLSPHFASFGLSSPSISTSFSRFFSLLVSYTYQDLRSWHAYCQLSFSLFFFRPLAQQVWALCTLYLLRFLPWLHRLPYQCCPGWQEELIEDGWRKEDWALCNSSESHLVSDWAERQSKEGNASVKISFLWSFPITEGTPFCTIALLLFGCWWACWLAIITSIRARIELMKSFHFLWPCWTAPLRADFLAKTLCVFWILPIIHVKYSTQPRYSWRAAQFSQKPQSIQPFLLPKASPDHFQASNSSSAISLVLSIWIDWLISSWETPPWLSHYSS